MVQCLFTTLSENTNITILEIAHNNLSSISPTLFVSVLNKLSMVDVDTCFLTSNQMVALFVAMSENTNITRLSIANSPLSAIGPDILITVLEKLHYIDMSDADVTAQQMLSMLAVSNTRLQKTTIEMDDFNIV